MAGYTQPLASATSGISFSRLFNDEVLKISVKRIHATPALDSMLGPVPGGLHDPALGAIQSLDINCTTCRLNSVHCAGHCGHIELPVPCYHPTFIDTTLRLLRAQCSYCHRFRPERIRISKIICDLRLLQYGLVEEYNRFQRIQLNSGKGQLAEGNEDEDSDELIERRIKFVNKHIAKVRKRKQDDSTIRNPIAVALRREVIADFIRQASAAKACSSCQGISPTYRKNKAVKIFRKPLVGRAKEKMRVEGRKIPNPLLVLEAQQLRWSKHKPSNGDVAMEETSDTVKHGAEDEIAIQSALTTGEEVEDQEDEQVYMSTTEVHAAMTLLFDREQEILKMIFNSDQPGPASANMFFIHAILVPPNKFRPLARQGPEQLLEAQQNSSLNRIIKATQELRHMIKALNPSAEDSDVRRRTPAEMSQAAVVLQEQVNTLIDSPPSPFNRQSEQGVKQLLEKKEGLFRMNMMGKRVNFAARSVISPDPNIETNEIGVPLVFAKRLTYPEPVTSYNFEQLQKAVINGMGKYPGATAIENEAGQVMSLKWKDLDQRKALANQLMTTAVAGARSGQTKKVYRHLQTGDVVVMNRQPTLHKPSMMGHRAKVLTDQKTIRMHYANCNTYNADFDGDEMNMHFPQNELARTEALQIADTDHQYLSATAGKPLRGLIQDHISMGVQFTSKDTFFDRDQYQQLLYNCLRPEDSHTIYERIETVPPAFLKPKQLWTGKQVITTVLKNILPDRYQGLFLTSKSSTSSESWGETTMNDPSKWHFTDDSVSFRDTEQIVIFHEGDHLSGTLDKGQLGPTVGGLVHSVHELFGHITAGKLLSILGRLLTRFLNERAWTCGMDDLYLTTEGDNKRRQELAKSNRLGFEVAAEYVTLKPDQIDQHENTLHTRLENVIRNDNQLNGLDQLYKSSLTKITDSVSKACVPAGLRKPFPRNQMQAMTISGAKGSGVNANLISSNLGQQVLEGRRVPIMVSGKSLPSFRPYETDPGAGGYVSGRFLTGIKPQEYYFHAMSGREGLIDTAVKTAKSGYLQRCVVKGLEGAKTEYDLSVRETSNGAVVQFLYGEDGLEITKQKHLREFSFLAQNFKSVSAAIKANDHYDTVSPSSVADEQKETMKAIKRGQVKDPVLALYSPATRLGSTSEIFASELSSYLKQNPDKLIRDKKTLPDAPLRKGSFQTIMDLKYMRSVVEPGEAVGVVAAQSIGEPSTQMTLNTFHLAGHSAKNVTLGIPRLREIVMTATRNIMTPTMTIRPIAELEKEEGVRFAKSISKLSLSHVVQDLTVIERADGDTEDEKIYDIRIKLYDEDEYKQEYAITANDVQLALEKSFLPKLHKRIEKEFKKKAKEATLSETTAAVPLIGASVGRIEEQRATRAGRASDREGGEDDIDEDADNDNAKEHAARSRREDTYDEPDEEEQAVANESDQDSDDDDDESASGKPSTMPNKISSEAGDSGYESDSINGDDANAQDRLDTLKQDHPHLKGYSFKHGNLCRIVLTYSSRTPKLLLLPIVEQAIHACLIQFIPGLGICTQFMEDLKTSDGKLVKVLNPETGKEEDAKEAVVTTEGVNLLAMRDFQDVINPHTIYTNSVHDMLDHYGIEAARMTIIKEIDGVFKGHGISVDNRHINLIADAMTHTGQYLAFSRHGIVAESGSVLAKMSFETVMGFLKDAVMYGESDPLLGPSARIVAGRRGTIGTGAFDVVMPVQ